MTESRTEEWFLGALDTNPIPVQAMDAAIFAAHPQTDPDRAWSWLELLTEKLAERRQPEPLVAVLRQWGDRHGVDDRLRALSLKTLKSALDPKKAAQWLDHAGFDNPRVPLSEALRRIDVLRGLVPDTLCHDKTWGFGIVRNIDDFYGKVEIDFDRKARHEMTLSYAAETLELIGPEHLMARRHADPAGFAQLIAEKPAEIVKIALHSFGPMNVAALQDRLRGSVVSESDWKRFWDAARKELKADRLVDFPARRADPIVLLGSEKEFGPAWFDTLSACTDMDRIFDLLEELLREEATDRVAAPEIEAIVRERLTFAMHGAESRRHDLMARFALLAERLGIEAASIGDGLLDRLFEPQRFIAAAEGLPVRERKDFLELLARRNSAQTRELVLDALPLCSGPTLNSFLIFLRDGNCDETVMARLHELLARHEPPLPLLAWLAKNIADPWSEAAVPSAELLLRAVAALERRSAGDALRAQNQLRALMENAAWLTPVLDSMTAQGRADLLTKVRDADDWDISSRRSVMAIIIRQYPDLARVTVTPEQAPEAPTARRFTSVASYRERHRQYKHLIEVEIPENSKDIGVARSYGDLRENAEYETARQQQGLLMARKAQWEQDLATVRETDFADFPCERAGMGTQVTLETDNGQTLHYHILGEWDRDETLNIVSCQSLLAQTLANQAPGATLTLPGFDPPRNARIVSIAPLPEPVRQWVRGNHS
jgi:transcription elongation GreA/GreB family factor